MAKKKRLVDEILSLPSTKRVQIDENEVLFSFISDEDAYSFIVWWGTVGSYLFNEYMENKEDE